jgi:hypothetical protein
VYRILIGKIKLRKPHEGKLIRPLAKVLFYHREHGDFEKTAGSRVSVGSVAGFASIMQDVYFIRLVFPGGNKLGSRARYPER